MNPKRPQVSHAVKLGQQNAMKFCQIQSRRTDISWLSGRFLGPVSHATCGVQGLSGARFLENSGGYLRTLQKMSKLDCASYCHNFIARDTSGRTPKWFARTQAKHGLRTLAHEGSMPLPPRESIFSPIRRRIPPIHEGDSLFLAQSFP